jgi:hypothetical protein
MTNNLKNLIFNIENGSKISFMVGQSNPYLWIELKGVKSV